MKASQLDRYLAAERAYDAAKENGASEDDAKAAAVKAVEEKREEQFLRRLGIGEARP